MTMNDKKRLDEKPSLSCHRPQGMITEVIKNMLMKSNCFFSVRLNYYNLGLWVSSSVKIKVCTKKVSGQVGFSDNTNLDVFAYLIYLHLQMQILKINLFR